MENYIYILIDPRTDCVRYVGKTQNLHERYLIHCRASSLKANTKKNNWIKSLKNKGLKPIMEVIHTIEGEEWRFWEIHYTDLYKSWGFDLLHCAEPGQGRVSKRTLEFMAKIKQTKIKNGTWKQKHTDLTKKTISEKNKHRIVTEETIKKRTATIAAWPSEKQLEYNKNKAFVGRENLYKVHEYRKGKSFETIYGKDKADEIKVKQSIVAKKTNESRKRKIYQFEINGVFFKEWLGLTDIKKGLNITGSSICQCCTGKYKTAGGYIWSYSRNAFLLK